MYRLNRSLRRLSKQSTHYYNLNRTKSNSVYKFLSNYAKRRTSTSTTSSSSSKNAIKATTSTNNVLSHTNKPKYVYSPLTSTYLNHHLYHTHKRTSSSAPAAATPNVSIPTPAASASKSSNSPITIAPPKRTLKDYKPIPCGKGFVIDTMSTNTKVDLNPKDFVPMDGNTSAAYVAYANSEVSFIYPISPATSMGEAMDTFSSAGKTNCISNQQVRVEVMQSEGGAAGAVHGALAAGAMSSTFTASQGLLLMIPNMYLIAGELMPCVFHISARTVAKQALCIYNDHSDVMAVRQCGWSLLCSNNAQEVMDLGLVAHLSTVKSRVPFLHFFDGNRTSHEINKIHRIPYDDISKLVKHDLIDQNLRRNSLNPVTPVARGTGQRPDIFFQSNMASERFYRECTKHIESSMEEVEQITGRRYNLFDYFGHPEAEKVVIIMGSAAQTTQQYIRSMVSNDNAKVGVIKVRCYRPWSTQHFFAALPETTKHISVLDRTREEGALGNPLFLDVAVSLKESTNPLMNNIGITGGSIGIGQKETTPSMIEAVFKNMTASDCKPRFTVGINDDVTFTSLPFDPSINDLSLPASTKQCLFWGLGSDGTVGANKEAIKMIGDQYADLNCQGYFSYDSKKSGGVTLSQLRFGPEKIESEYQITKADYIAVHNSSNQFMQKLDLLQAIKPDGIFVLNSPWKTLAELEANLPARMKKQIANNNVAFYNIDAGHIAKEIGLKGRINMIMQSVFYKLSNIIPADEATDLLKSSIKRMFGKKGEEIVAKNIKAVDEGSTKLQKIDYDKAAWSVAVDNVKPIDNWDHLLYSGIPDFVTNIMEPCMQWEGDDLPVSAFEPGGVFPVGTTRYERRGAAPEIPVWLADKCTQCNYCAIVCPHAVIRPFLLTKDDVKNAPSDYISRKASGTELGGLNFSIQVAPMDCTGCAVCVQACPDDALYMGDFTEHAQTQLPHFEYSMTLPNRQPMDKYSVKGSQFEQPLLEFHGACAGCGETPYVKLVTQLFGEQMMIANASGCSSVWGGTCTTHPYTTNKETGHGPAWGRSLFEDNAEYGYGMALAALQRRDRLLVSVQTLLQNLTDDNVSDPNLLVTLKKWVSTYDNFKANNNLCSEMDKSSILSKCKNDHPLVYNIYKQKEMFRPQSQWLIGGDGWAYDIGSGGLDHILSKGENINILILDTEIYSNTGGQSSKSSVAGQVTKFESLGKTRHKKDLASIAIAYGDVYVASIALGADYNQTVKSFKEAAEHPGTSIIMAYSPCIDWGIDTKDMADIQKVAVETGYWELYRYDPKLGTKGQNPMQLDSRRIKKPIKTYLNSENRFRQLQRQNEERAAELQGSLEDWIIGRHDKLLRQSMDDMELLDFLKSQLGIDDISSDKILLLYGSETGNAAEFAQIVASDLKKRAIRTKVMACDDYDYNDLPKEQTVIFILATCGQGELPSNCKDMYNSLSNSVHQLDLSSTNIGVFGMGDSHYVYFNKAAELYDDILRNKFNGNMLMDSFGKGDDQDDEKYESAWEDFGQSMYTKLMLPEPERILLPASYSAELHNNISDVEQDIVIPSGAKIVPIIENRLLTPIDYERDTRHYEFDTAGMSYEVGDTLGIYPHNDASQVSAFCEWYGFNENDVIKLVDNMSDRADALPSNLTINQLFTQVLDIFGRPKKRFYELLSLVATDPSEKSHLENLPDNEYKNNLKETFDHSDLLKQYKSARPSIEHMIDYIPRIKPRLYSIASSPNEQPDNIALCVILDDWTTPSGDYKKGLCSNYLTLQQPQLSNSVIAKVNAGVVAMPSTHDKPMIMAGLGTGLAPLRGMVRDRCWAIKNDPNCKNVGDMALYFGARHKRNEWLYESEWEEFHQNGKGPLTHLRPAFSRDQDYKIYIQDKINEDAEIIYDYLVNQNGYFYACGSSAVQDLKHYVAKCIAKVGKMSDDDAQQYVTNMIIEGRYCIESW